MTDSTSTPISNIPPRSPGRLAAIDYGTVRIGIAVTDVDQRFCSPYENYNRRALRLDGEYFKTFAREERIVTFIVGLPTHLHGGESAKSVEARKFGDWLSAQTGVPVEYYDERYTSVEAENLLREAGYKASERKKKLDMLAAQILLSAYLEARNANANQAKPQDSADSASQPL